MQKSILFQFFKSDVWKKQRIFKYNLKMLLSRKFDKNDITFTHLPKLNFIEYLCSMGGLISMWFGLNVFQFTKEFIHY